MYLRAVVYDVTLLLYRGCQKMYYTF